MPYSFLSEQYAISTETHVWSRSDYQGIAYNDGDAVEEGIASVISAASDLSVLSDELRLHCKDWPTLYHLSGSRANVLRPFEQQLKGDILEIGAGCGAITRYLGECGANILALEGTPRRAAIARSRTRDLENVTVLAETFVDFEVAHKFDVITLIGVLEYANLFMPGESPAEAMLKRVRSMLKPDGILILAIENQLGLKYFAGAPEDHLGKAMVGLEGRYESKGVRTYGRSQLHGLLEGSGFQSINFNYPFPDYKLPSLVLTEEAFETEGLDVASIVSQTVTKDPQLPLTLNFSLDLTWKTIIDNGVARDLSNSFLCVAGNTSLKNITSVVAWHYSTSRLSKYCKTKMFHVEKEEILVSNEKMTSDIDCAETLIDFVPAISEYYQKGKLLSLNMIDVFSNENWSIQEISQLFKKQLCIVKDAIGLGRDQSVLLPGACLDAVPSNIIVNSSDGGYLIDQEWAHKEPIAIEWLITRSFLILLKSSLYIAESSRGYHRHTIKTILQNVLVDLGLDASDEMLESSIKNESQFISYVTGVDSEIYYQELNEFLSCQIAKVSRVQKCQEELARHSRDLANEIRKLEAIYSSFYWRVRTKMIRLILSLMFKKNKTINSKLK